MAYNHSAKNGREKIIVQPTETIAGRVRALHATKGWRETRIAPLVYKNKYNAAQRFYALMGALPS